MSKYELGNLFYFAECLQRSIVLREMREVVKLRSRSGNAQRLTHLSVGSQQVDLTIADELCICNEKIHIFVMTKMQMRRVTHLSVSGVPRGLMPPQMYLPGKDSFGFFEFLDFLDA